jgi:WD40 repeat protein
MRILKGHTRRLNSLAFSADGRHLLTASADETARLWDLATGAEVTRYRTERASVGHALFVPHQVPVRVLLGTRTRLLVWEPDTGRATEFPGDGAFSRAFAPDGAYLASIGAPEEGVVRWNPATGEPLDAWSAGPPTRMGLAFSPDGSLLATGCADGTVALWDTATGQPTRRLGQPAPNPRITSPAGLDQFIAHVAFAGGSRTLVTATSQTLAVWDTTTGQSLATYRHKGKHNQGIAVTPDGRLLATANNDASVRFRGLPELEERASFAWKAGAILAVTFAPDGFRCAAGGRSGKVVVWDVDE